MKEIKVGHTNKKYKDGDRFVLIKNKNGFNHLVDYKKLSEFDFVPKLIEETDEKLVWEWIEGDMIIVPTDDDLKKLGIIIRTLHKSDVSFPKNNLKKRIMSYIKTTHAKGLRVPEIEDNFREMNKLLTRMGRINPCHNDLWSQNLIRDKNGKIWLVDWEYATMGDKHFDVEYLIESYNLETKQKQIFLDAYDSMDDYHAYIEEWMPKYQKLVIWITICWAHAQDKMPFPLKDLKERIKKI